jgi:hypothetical protein
MAGSNLAAITSRKSDMGRSVIKEEKIPGLAELMRLARSMSAADSCRFEGDSWEAYRESFDAAGKKVVKIGKCTFGVLQEGRFFAKCDSPDLKVNIVGKKRDIVNIVLMRSLISVGYKIRKKK